MAKSTYRRWTSWPILSPQSHEAGIESELSPLNSSKTHVGPVVLGLRAGGVLNSDGVLTQDEFEIEKRKVLGHP